jgi:hypothetical protein
VDIRQSKVVKRVAFWQMPEMVAGRLIGSIRRECVDHVLVLGEAHLRRVLTKYAAYYNELRTHRLSTKTLRSIAPSSTWAASFLRPSSADLTTIIAESDFRYRQLAFIAAS